VFDLTLYGTKIVAIELLCDPALLHDLAITPL